VHLGVPARSQGVLATSLGVPMTSLGAPVSSLGLPATRLRAPRITVEQSGKNIFVGSAAGAPGMLQVRLEIVATTYYSMIVKTHVFRLYSHLSNYVSMYLCIYIATHLHTIYLDWLQAVYQKNSRCA
jgi:hypothetical protein